MRALYHIGESWTWPFSTFNACSVSWSDFESKEGKFNGDGASAVEDAAVTFDRSEGGSACSGDVASFARKVWLDGPLIGILSPECNSCSMNEYPKKRMQVMTSASGPAENQL